MGVVLHVLQTCLARRGASSHILRKNVAMTTRLGGNISARICRIQDKAGYERVWGVRTRIVKQQGMLKGFCIKVGCIIRKVLSRGATKQIRSEA